MEKRSAFLYSLRYSIEPGFNETDRLGDLVSFCLKADIDDVMFFINAGELNQGHLTIPETAPWMELIRRGKEKLEPMGISTSINPWVTLLHADVGRTLKQEQKFGLMVDPYGNMASAQVCPLCEEWREYIDKMYAYYAELNPFAVWVEDDFRLHNHSPLIWGGCFCDKHMTEYSKRAGKSLTREEFVEGILKPGKPHPYRRIWLETSRDTMVDLARHIGQAVHRVSPLSRVGLMSSSPEVHCAEGRDWEGILRGLSSDMPMVNRPNLPCYVESSAQQYLINFNNMSRMSRILIPDTTEIYPELENYPDTRFAKSLSFTRFQLETSSVLGADGITIAISDVMGNGLILEEGYDEIFRDSKEFLTLVKGLELDASKQKGVIVPVNPESSFTLHTSEGKRMEELYPEENIWSGLLSSYGIANTYSLDKSHHGCVLAVSGQYFRNLDNKEIIDLFSDNFIILDGQAAYTLFDMDLGYLVGISEAAWHIQDSGFQAYEQVCDGKDYCGLKEARISSQGSAGDFLNIKYVEEPLKITIVKKPDGETAANGMVIYDNRVLILPYGKLSDRFQSHLNPIRQEIFQDALKENMGMKCPVFVKGNPYIGIYEYRLERRKVMVLFNASGDDLKQVKIYAPGWHGENVMEVNRTDKRLVKADLITNEDYLILKSGLKSLELKVLVIQL